MALSSFPADTKAVRGVAGCSSYEPRLVISLWVLASGDAVCMPFDLYLWHVPPRKPLEKVWHNLVFRIRGEDFDVSDLQ